jgi:hypothetical protein
MNIRYDLERRLGREATEAAWGYMVAEGHVAAVENGERDRSWLVNKAMSFLEHAGKSSLISGRPVQMLTDDQRKRVAERHQVLSILWAKEAEAEIDVVAFRKEVLRGKLLKWKDLETWLEDRAKADGPATNWLDLPLPSTHRLTLDAKAGFVPTPPLMVSEKWGARGSQTRVLAYASPSDAWERCLPTAANGVLERLRQISERLSGRYRWQEAQATIFILTGRAPLVRPAEPKIEREAIVLTVDPSLTPRQVADYYRQFKKSILGGSRIKALSSKHLQLAAFAADRPSEETWAKKMQAWNRSVPKKEWHYKNDAYFRRDCLQAQRRLLAPLPPPERRFLRHIKNQRDEQEQE